jgi:hypothetical protein
MFGWFSLEPGSSNIYPAMDAASNEHLIHNKPILTSINFGNLR